MSKYSTQFKLKVVKEFLKSGALKRVAHLFMISHSQVRNWVLAHLRSHPCVFKLLLAPHLADHLTLVGKDALAGGADRVNVVQGTVQVKNNGFDGMHTVSQKF
jgi:hypothetical protein